MPHRPGRSGVAQSLLLSINNRARAQSLNLGPFQKRLLKERNGETAQRIPSAQWRTPEPRDLIFPKGATQFVEFSEASQD